MRLRTISVTVSVCLVAGSGPARAYVPEETVSRRTEATARDLSGARAARGARASILLTRKGREIFRSGVDEPLRPASVIKLFTTTAAIVRFGPEHRFTTRVVRSGERFFLVGGGDPTFATEAYRRERFLPSPDDAPQRDAFRTRSPTVEDLASRIARTGVKRIARLSADESLFDSVRTQRGWPARYLGFDPLTGLLSALTVNEGRADLEGKILERDPPGAAVEALATALRARGVTVGKVDKGTAPQGASNVAGVLSPPVSELVDWINRYSVNFAAEIMLKNLGARATGKGTTSAGAREILDVMSEIGVDMGGAVIDDGSGLSTIDRLRARSVAGLLNEIVRGKGAGWKALRESLPAAAGPGTLRRRMSSGPAKGNLRAKTGSVRGVRAMAGWVTPADGVPMVFVVMFDGASSTPAFNSPFDRFGNGLAGL